MKKFVCNNVAFSLTTVAAIALMIAGFIVPPTGVIDSSVLTACGILFAFASLAQLPNIIGKAKRVDVQAGGVTLTAHGASADNTGGG